MHPTLYEFPLNERMRNFMRLENCFAQIEHFMTRNDIWDSQAALLALIEALNILEKNDIRSDLAKEVDRSIGILNNLLDVPGVSGALLQDTLRLLNEQSYVLQNMQLNPARLLREDDFLNTIRQRASLIAGANSFEIPSFYNWLNKPAKIRQQELGAWLQQIFPLVRGVSLLLNLLRDSSDFELTTANAGFFQKSLSGQICQMVRIELPEAGNYFPDISGSKHRISIRFLSYEPPKQRPQQIEKDLEFAISCCGI